mmetsp:Transcript_10288/g.19468  ORF Transcript_10288/g.19468 Transcript_10288/m.19468 type:complete len:223 (+) Transcript_10288:156-824(+)|eukprot:CAMPEP_0114260000 /NCGR_PEP_ID=MMETSP0058-20121206/20211_1 /TAXON_ID=36894 /ORGANISM="Pyramimonas parkeae, CCMP726" /LENGTH=222 /DNA_ID=CAMNT_0001375121 /DNA_START=141 /DNA_END=809 /DNA_ORIENTATION=-
MAKLPPPREKYDESKAKAVFEALEGKTVPDGRLALAEIAVAMEDAEWTWASAGLNDEGMNDALTKARRLNGDVLMNWEEFWNFCLKNGTGHPPDPAEIAKEYLMTARIMPLFETMTAALLFHKPDKPKHFLVEKLQNLKTGSGEEFFTETDLKTMYGMFDITSRGSITVDQCNAALQTLLGMPKDCRDSFGKGTQLLNCDQFVKVMKESLDSVAPVPAKPKA